MRRAPRRRDGGQAFIRVPGYRMNIPCCVSNISATGARLIFTATNAHHLPDRVVVAFRDRTEIDAEIRWRTGNECGVRFVSLFRRAQPAPRTE